MWLAIWGFLVVFVFVFVGWTLLVLIQQKKTWAAYAKKNKLKYEAGRFMDAAVVSGDMNGLLFSLYSGVQKTEDVRGQRFVTVIEFQMGKGMPTGAAIATNEFSGFIDGLIFNHSYKPELTEWRDDYIVKTRDKKNLRAYFSKERQQVISSLFKMKNAAVLFFFDEIEAVLRIETSDPLRDESHLRKIVQRVIMAVDVLAPTAIEKKEFKKLLKEEKKRQEDDEEDEDEDEDEEGAGLEEEKPQKKKTAKAKQKKNSQEDDE